MKRLRNFLRLKPDDRNLLIYTYLLLNGIRLGLWRLPFAKLQRYLDRLGDASFPGQSIAVYRLQTLIWAVNQSSHYSPGLVKCLARALTTQVLLKQQGYPCELRIGVAKGQTGTIEAHAWIESRGQIVIGYLPDLSRYKPLNRSVSQL